MVPETDMESNDVVSTITEQTGNDREYSVIVFNDSEWTKIILMSSSIVITGMTVCLVFIYIS